MKPKLALSAKVEKSVENVLEHAVTSGFDAIDWSFHPNDFIEHELTERWLHAFNLKYPGVEIRYHTPWGDIEIAHKDNTVSDRAVSLLTRSIDVIERLGGRFLTVHIGLNADGPQALCMDKAKTNLARLVEYGRKHEVIISLENLKNGQTSEPEQFLELIGFSGAMVTLDIGHALSSEAHENGWPCQSFIRAVSPWIINAHIYESETDRHNAPTDLSIIGPSLTELLGTGCDWWVIELADANEVAQTRRLLEEMLGRSDELRSCPGQAF